MSLDVPRKPRRGNSEYLDLKDRRRVSATTDQKLHEFDDALQNDNIPIDMNPNNADPSHMLSNVAKHITNLRFHEDDNALPIDNL